MNGFHTRAKRRMPQPANDTSLLFTPDAEVDVLLDCGGGRMERWRGQVVTPASGQRRSVELAPFGCGGNSIEFQIDDVRECTAYQPPTRNADVIESLQRARLRGVRR